MKSAPPEEGGCNAAFPLILPYKKIDAQFFASVRFPFPGALLFFEHPLSFYSGLFTVCFLCDNITEDGAEN